MKNNKYFWLKQYRYIHNCAFIRLVRDLKFSDLSALPYYYNRNNNICNCFTVSVQCVREDAGNTSKSIIVFFEIYYVSEY